MRVPGADAASGNGRPPLANFRRCPISSASPWTAEDCLVNPYFLYTGFRAKLHPEILAVTRGWATSLELPGHTVVKGNPDLRPTVVVELARSTAASGNGRSGQRRGWIVATYPTCAWDTLSQRFCAARRHLGRRTRCRVGLIFDIVDVVPPTIAQIHRQWRARLTGWASPIAPSSSVPVARPWNPLGWPSIMPVGFTSDGLPGSCN